MYDNTKLEAAFAAWLEKNVTLGYGEHYAGDLLTDFESFLRETKMLKRSPGRVAFGKLLTKQGTFETRKRLGLTYWSGLELKNPPEGDALEPRRYRRTKEYQDEQAEKTRRIKEEAEFVESPEAEQARLSAFKAELETETPEAIRAVGQRENV
jgi:hypothetical protein